MLVSFGALIGVAAATGAPGGAVATCPPIRYAFAGSPPPHSASEFESAARELHRHTGLTFVPASEGVRLTVRWQAVTSEVVASQETRRRSTLIGSGLGRWNVVGLHRQFVGGVIEIDPRLPWQRGLARGDMLASVLAHELGHVVGLPHSADSSSFMYAEALPHEPRWTEDDVVRLGRIGREAGCEVTSLRA